MEGGNKREVVSKNASRQHPALLPLPEMDGELIVTNSPPEHKRDGKPAGLHVERTKDR
jgi:hypothetical protein